MDKPCLITICRVQYLAETLDLKDPLRLTHENHAEFLSFSCFDQRMGNVPVLLGMRDIEGLAG